VDHYCYADWDWKVYLIKFLKGILRTVRKRIEEMKQKNGNRKVADWVIEEASMEKMGAMMCDNSQQNNWHI